MRRVFLPLFCLLLIWLPAPRLAGAVLSSVTLDAFNRGWVDEDGRGNRGSFNYLTGTDFGDSDEHRNWFVFDLSVVTERTTIGAATLRLLNPLVSGGFHSDDPTETYELHAITSDLDDLIGRSGGQTAFEDLGSGVLYGQHIASSADNGAWIEIPLNAGAIADLRHGAVRWAVGGRIATLDPTHDPERLFAFTHDDVLSDTQLVLEFIPEPGSGALLSLAAGCALLGRRRR